MNAASPLSKIELKVKALLAKANSTTNEHEAAAFAEKAHSLLAAHNLDLAKLAAADDKFADAKVVERKTEGYAKGWEGQLAAAVARLYFCNVYMHAFTYKTKAGKEYTLRGVAYVGKQHNVDVAVSMTEYLVSTCRRLSKVRPVAGRNSFQQGCAHKLVQRLDEMRSKAQLAVASAISDGSNLPALYRSEAQQVDDYMAKLGLRRGRSTTVKVSDDYLEGLKAGKDVGLHDQVHAQPAPKRLQ